jgi:hypothetical protein
MVSGLNNPKKQNDAEKAGTVRGTTSGVQGRSRARVPPFGRRDGGRKGRTGGTAAMVPGSLLYAHPGTPGTLHRPFISYKRVCVILPAGYEVLVHIILSFVIRPSVHCSWLQVSTETLYGRLVRASV